MTRKLQEASKDVGPCPQQESDVCRQGDTPAGCWETQWWQVHRVGDGLVSSGPPLDGARPRLTHLETKGVK